MDAASLRILLVEDQAELAASIIDFLEGQGHRLDYAADGQAGLDLALSQDFDVVLLDLQLPRLDGLAVCRQLRESADRHLPVLMLTARGTLDNKVEGFEAGADDYLTKPFALEELLLRCNALGRRHQLHARNELLLGDLLIDRRRRVATRQGRVLDLHHTPFDILVALAEAYPAVMTRSELADRIWGDEPPASDALATHIYSLRQALDRPFEQAMLKTLHGVGLRLEVPE
ncbi:response regulator transcription factor [Wenzhouxiangella marina]|uniref:XRE family transcriptional regulator n=1 Tax=Wenzhouxiangella marina TaxID=1579979 RepID=A0A0K0XYG2_9GAMM|nr:response regulator transcription factor [Wenzhouxiangella marina]AKS42700.1 XRE family transcriptional regulator [Wenzhouxiangella marina]MBB6088611.1 DNA-binding response OmpR family regulator [Wenzhouxiangella marina]